MLFQDNQSTDCNFQLSVLLQVNSGSSGLGLEGERGDTGRRRSDRTSSGRPSAPGGEDESGEIAGVLFAKIKCGGVTKMASIRYEQ